MFRICTLVLILALASMAVAQSPFLRGIEPVGSNRTDASSVTFEAEFSEPVVFGVGTTSYVVSGTFGGTIPPSTGRPEMGFDLNFSSEARRAIVPSGVNIGSSFTVEFLHRPSTAAAQRAVFSYAEPPGGSSSTNGILYFHNGSIAIDGTFYNTGAISNGANTWHHVAISYNSPLGQIRVYSDGVLTDTINAVANVATNGYLVLGDDQDTFGGGFDATQGYLGRVADVRIWNDVRSSGEINANLYAPVSPTAQGLEHNWTIPDTGDSRVDVAGGQDLTYVNGLSVIVSQAPSQIWRLTYNTAGITSPGVINLDLSGSASHQDLDGNALVPNPLGGPFNASVFYAPCTTPEVIATAALPVPSDASSQTRPLNFTENVVDVTASDLSLGGVASSGSSITVQSEFQTAASLSNVSGRLDAGSGATLGTINFPTGELTLECWFRTNNTAACIASFATSNANDNTFTIWADGHVDIDEAITIPSIDLGQVDGSWHHIAITRSATGVLSRYIDGVPAGVNVANNLSTQPGIGFLIFGQDQDSLGGSFQSTQALQGAIDEIRLWTVARTAGQIASSYDTIVSSFSSGLLHYWQCDNVVFDCIPDSTGSTVDLDFTNQGIPLLIDGAGNTDSWFVTFDHPAQTAFTEVTLAAGHGIQNGCGQSAVSDPGGEPAIEQVFVEDLTTSVSVQGGSVEYYNDSASPGNNIILTIESPNGTHDFATVPSFFGQFITTGTEPGNVGVFGFPELRLDLFSANAPFVIYDGATTGPFAPGVLPPGGINFAAIVPSGLSGLSLSCQAIANGNTTTANAIFAVSNVLVLDL